MKKTIQLLLIISFIIIISCKDNDPKSTPAPTPIPVEEEDEWPNFVDTGANVVAYKVNGKIRVTKNISKIDSTRGYISCFYFLHQQYKLFAFEGNRISDERFEGIVIEIGDLEQPGMYKIGGNSYFFNNGSYFGGPEESSAKQYSTNELDSGYIVITKIDTIKGYITGTFEFTGRYAFGTEKKKITEGRFDLKYYR